MKKEQLDNLWELYREFCSSINATAIYVPDFLAWIERRKMPEEVGEDYIVLGNRCVERPTTFCTTYAYKSVSGKFGHHTIHTGTCNDCKNKIEEIPTRCACGNEWKHEGEHDEPIVS